MTIETLRQENLESFANPEKKLPRTQCLAVLGRGVERVETKDGEKWKLSRYIQQINSKRPGRFLLKTDRIKQEDLLKDQTERIISGGTAVVLGAIQYIHEIRDAKPLIIMAGGRPEYLNEAPAGLSEGGIMKQELLRHVPDAEVMASPDNDTYEGVLHSLATANERGLSSVTFVTIELHMPRVKEFCAYIRREHPQYQHIKAEFVTAEDLIRRRYAHHPAQLAQFERIQKELHETDAWKLTTEREERGIQRLRDGTYWSKP